MILSLSPASANAAAGRQLVFLLSSFSPFLPQHTLSALLPMSSSYVLAGWITLFGSTGASLKQEGRVKQCL